MKRGIGAIAQSGEKEAERTERESVSEHKPNLSPTTRQLAHFMVNTPQTQTEGGLETCAIPDVQCVAGHLPSVSPAPKCLDGRMQFAVDTMFTPTHVVQQIKCRWSANIADILFRLTPTDGATLSASRTVAATRWVRFWSPTRTRGSSVPSSLRSLPPRSGQDIAEMIRQRAGAGALSCLVWRASERARDGGRPNATGRTCGAFNVPECA